MKEAVRSCGCGRKAVIRACRRSWNPDRDRGCNVCIFRGFNVFLCWVYLSEIRSCIKWANNPCNSNSKQDKREKVEIMKNLILHGMWLFWSVEFEVKGESVHQKLHRRGCRVYEEWNLTRNWTINYRKAINDPSGSFGAKAFASISGNSGVRGKQEAFVNGWFVSRRNEGRS